MENSAGLRLAVGAEQISAKTADIPRLSMLAWACPDQDRSVAIEINGAGSTWAHPDVGQDGLGPGWDHFEFEHCLSDFPRREFLRSDLARDHGLVDEQSDHDAGGPIGPRRHDDLHAHQIEGRLWRPWMAHDCRPLGVDGGIRINDLIDPRTCA